MPWRRGASTDLGSEGEEVLLDPASSSQYISQCQGRIQPLQFGEADLVYVDRLETSSGYSRIAAFVITGTVIGESSVMLSSKNPGPPGHVQSHAAHSALGSVRES